MIRFFGDSLWHGRPARDLCASTDGTPMSQCEPDGSRGFHGLKGSEIKGPSEGMNGAKHRAGICRPLNAQNDRDRDNSGWIE
jgi:hypothetical protein